MSLTPFEQNLLAKYRAQFEAIDTALLTNISGGIVSYKLDTGQGSQSVVKITVTEAESLHEKLATKIIAMEARLVGGDNVVYMGPAF